MIPGQRIVLLYGIQKNTPTYFPLKLLNNFIIFFLNSVPVKNHFFQYIIMPKQLISYGQGQLYA